MATTNKRFVGTGRGRRPKAQTMAEAFAPASSRQTILRCGDCPYFRNGWCSVQAKARPSIGVICNYGRARLNSERVKRNALQRAIESREPKSSNTRSLEDGAGAHGVV